MIKILSEQITRILKSKKKLEKVLNLKITNKGKELIIEGEPEDEYIGQKVIDAINFGFLTSTALLIKTEEYSFEILKIKDHTKRKDKKTVRARLIGKQGRTLKNLTELTNAHLEINTNEIGIIAPPQELQIIQNAIISIIRGSKQSHVYAKIIKNKPEPILDLGLKEKTTR